MAPGVEDERDGQRDRSQPDVDRWAEGVLGGFGRAGVRERASATLACRAAASRWSRRPASGSARRSAIGGLLGSLARLGRVRARRRRPLVGDALQPLERCAQLADERRAGQQPFEEAKSIDVMSQAERRPAGGNFSVLAAIRGLAPQAANVGDLVGREDHEGVGAGDSGLLTKRPAGERSACSRPKSASTPGVDPVGDVAQRVKRRVCASFQPASISANLGGVCGSCSADARLMISATSSFWTPIVQIALHAPPLLNAGEN